MKQAFVILLALGLLRPAATATQQGPQLVIRDVTIIDITGASLWTNSTVVVDGKRVRTVGPAAAVPVPADAKVVDASGLYVIPGFINMHVHLFNNVSGRPPNAWSFPLFVANGVMGVREMWTQLASMPQVDQWRRETSAGTLLAPRVLAAGALVDGPGAWYPNMVEARTPAEGRHFVREAARAGVDFIKVYSHLAPEVYRAVVAEARRAGLPVSGHIPLQVPVLEAVRAGHPTNEHLYQVREACSTIEDQLLEERRQFYSGPTTEANGYALLDAQVIRAGAFDERICRTVARALAESRQWQVPTLVNERRWFLGVSAARANDPRLIYVPARERADWRRRLEGGSVTYSGHPASLRRAWESTLRVVHLLGDAGTGIIAGTDFGQPFVVPGFAMHEEMEALVQAGLTPLQALQAATINPARSLGATDSLGSVAPGKLADLVLLEANPLEDIRNTQRISAVVLNGRYLDREALDQLLAEAEAAAEANQ